MNKLFEHIDAFSKNNNFVLEDSDPARFGTYKPGDLVQLQDVYTSKYYGKFKVIGEMDPKRSKEKYGSEVIGYEVEVAFPGDFEGDIMETNNYRMRPYKIEEAYFSDLKKEDGIRTYFDMLINEEPQSEYDEICMKYMEEHDRIRREIEALKEKYKKDFRNPEFKKAYSKLAKDDEANMKMYAKAQRIPVEERGPLYKEFMEIDKANDDEFAQERGWDTYADYEKNMYGLHSYGDEVENKIDGKVEIDTNLVEDYYKGAEEEIKIIRDFNERLRNLKTFEELEQLEKDMESTGLGLVFRTRRAHWRAYAFSDVGEGYVHYLLSDSVSTRKQKLVDLWKYIEVANVCR